MPRPKAVAQGTTCHTCTNLVHLSDVQEITRQTQQVVRFHQVPVSSCLHRVSCQHRAGFQKSKDLDLETKDLSCSDVSSAHTTSNPLRAKAPTGSLGNRTGGSSGDCSGAARQARRCLIRSASEPTCRRHRPTRAPTCNRPHP